MGDLSIDRSKRESNFLTSIAVMVAPNTTIGSAEAGTQLIDDKKASGRRFSSLGLRQLPSLLKRRSVFIVLIFCALLLLHHHSKNNLLSGGSFSSAEWPRDAIPNSSRRMNEKRKVFIDLGANCGNTYLKRKQQLDSEGGWEVLLWEPSPQMFTFFLDDLGKQNPNIRILPYAAGANNGEVKLYIHKGQEHVTDKSQFRDQGKCEPNSPYNPSGGSTVFQQAKVAGEAVSIKQLNFPKWLAQMKLQTGDRLILKVDIEGSEVDIMNKMLSTTTKEEEEDDDDASICMAELIEMEFHKNIFDKQSQEYQIHEDFENNFMKRFEEKCGRKVKLKKLS